MRHMLFRRQSRWYTETWLSLLESNGRRFQSP
jgi:hypothetical protein